MMLIYQARISFASIRVRKREKKKLQFNEQTNNGKKCKINKVHVKYITEYNFPIFFLVSNNISPNFKITLYLYLFYEKCKF